jgi:hypothetical protein
MAQKLMRRTVPVRVLVVNQAPGLDLTEADTVVLVLAQEQPQGKPVALVLEA